MTGRPVRLARRSFLATVGAMAASLGVAGSVDAAPPEGVDALARWIRARTDPPTFPDRVVLVTDHGAVGDGDIDCTTAFRDAIRACANAGGGHVLVPPGTYRTGAIHLLDDIDLHIDAGATIAFSRDPADYLPAVYTRYEGIELYNHSPFVYAYGRRNVAITGRGTLDGRADEEHWWDWSGGEPPNESPDKERLANLADQGVPVADRMFGAGHHLRPNLLQLYACRNVLLEDVTVRDSPMWNIHPVLCRNVTIRGVRVDSPHGPNNDGCNPESCADVVIERCTFDTGDDCVAFKAGKDADGRRVDVPCVNALVEDCDMSDGNGGVVIGSETTGGVRTVVARDCRMDSPRLERALRIKSNPDRGGYVRDVHAADITVGTVADSVIEIALDYANVQTGDHYPDVGDIHIRDLVADRGPRALYLVGNELNPIHDVSLRDCRFRQMADENVVEQVVALSVHDVWINGSRIDEPETGGADDVDPRHRRRNVLGDG